MLSPTFKELGAKKVVGCTIYTSGTQTDFPNIWDVFMKRIGDVPNAVNPTVTYALEFYGQEFVTESKWFYMPCVEVSSFDDIPMTMVAKYIPAARYAVFEHIGKVSGIPDLYSRIYKEWLPASNFELAFDFDFELYDERFTGMDNPDSVMEIYIPVLEKSV